MSTLKEKILKKFFNYEYNVIKNSQEEINNLNKRVNILSNENKDNKRLYELLSKAFDQYDMVFGLEQNKNKHTTIVTGYSNDEEIDIYLINTNILNNRQRPYIQSILHTDYRTGEIRLEITDVQSISNSIGNGTIMMKYFIKEAKRKNVKSIYGLLSEVDKNNFFRSVPYYKKFGFEVKLNKSGTSGKIELVLDKGR